MTSPEFRPCPPDEAPAIGLLADMVAEMRQLYSISGPDVGVPLRVEELGPPGGLYLVGWVGDEPAVGGGLRLITARVAEIKRMYVRPAYRSQGLARALLVALEEAAVVMGADCARLDTGAKQAHAQSLYERSGYVAIANWNNNPHAAYWGEKRLV